MLSRKRYHPDIQVVLKALTDPSTIEYKTSTFKIGHDFADLADLAVWLRTFL